MFLDYFMDQIDVEILWTLKQTESHYLKEIDIRKNNSKLTNNDELKAKFRYLAEGRFIESVPAVFGSGYILKKSGNDLFWSGKLKHRILNLLYVHDYTLDDLNRVLCESFDDISTMIMHLQKNSVPLVEKYDDSSDGLSRYTITSSGEILSSPNFAERPPANTESFSQVRIGQIDIQSFETKIDELISQVSLESTLSEENKKIFKEKLTNLKNTWNDTSKFGQQILPQLDFDGFKELFLKSTIL